jgi:hypothetical protein
VGVKVFVFDEVGGQVLIVRAESPDAAARLVGEYVGQDLYPHADLLARAEEVSPEGGAGVFAAYST